MHFALIVAEERTISPTNAVEKYRHLTLLLAFHGERGRTLLASHDNLDEHDRHQDGGVHPSERDESFLPTSSGGPGARMLAPLSACRDTLRTPRRPQVCLRETAEATTVTADTGTESTAVLAQHARLTYSFHAQEASSVLMLRSLVPVISFRSTCGRTRNIEGGAPTFNVLRRQSVGRRPRKKVPETPGSRVPSILRVPIYVWAPQRATQQWV